MYKTKIAVVGPCESGKTHISNYIAEATEVSREEYKTTQGVRILEFETTVEDQDTGKSCRVEVELWDCSGSTRFETCWPAICKDVHGVLIVYNPYKSQQERDIEKWYNYFVKQQHVKDSQCLLLAHQQPNVSSLSRNRLNSPMMASVQCLDTNLEQDPDGVKDIFSKFLTNICNGFKDTQDKEEQVIVNNQTL